MFIHFKWILEWPKEKANKNKHLIEENKIKIKIENSVWNSTSAITNGLTE